MRKSGSIVKGLIFLILFFQISHSPAQDFGKTPFRLCWQNEKDDSAAVFIASDNVQFFYSAFSDGSIEAINKNNGKTIWHSELGGEVLPGYFVDKTKLYVISKDLPLQNDQQNESKISETEINVIALSTETGITKWQSSLPLKTDENIYLFGNEDKLYLITDMGRLYFLNKETGKIELEKQLEDHPVSPPFLYEHSVYFGTFNKKIVEISTSNGNKESENDLKSTPTAILPINEKEIYIGNEFGEITAYNLAEGKPRWQVLTGAKIAGILKIGRGILVSSLDNYVYLLSERNGKRLWRKRLSGRSVGLPFVKNNVAVFATLNGNDAVFIELDKGKAVNRIILPEENYFLDNPVGADNLLLFRTYKGLSAFGAESECKQK